MKEENVKRLENELRFLEDDAWKSEIEKYSAVLANDKVDTKKLAMEIYQSRGINYQKLNKGFFNTLMETITEFGTLFKNKSGNIRGKMFLEMLVMVLLLVFLKVPFDFVRDLGFDYIELLTNNNILYVIWNLVFLFLYTIVFICTLIVLMRNFNSKYRDK